MITFAKEYNSCPLCDHTNILPNFSINVGNTRLRWSACDACGLTFQNPRISSESLSELYQTMDYFGRADGHAAAYSDYVRYEPIRLAQSRRRLAEIKKVTGVVVGRLLDVGSASGFFGAAAKEQGFEVLCVEPDRELADFGRNHYGLRFEVAAIEGCSLQPSTFDLITIWGTDSHFIHPLHSFEQLVAALKTGGILAFNYQAFDHWIRWLAPSVKRRWNVIYNHTDRSIDILLQKIGATLLLRKLEWQTVSVDHFCRQLSVPPPQLIKHVHLRVPAVSYRFVVARRS
jgi:SAM-dependent methyltransferase